MQYSVADAKEGVHLISVEKFRCGSTWIQIYSWQSSQAEGKFAVILGFTQQQLFHFLKGSRKSEIEQHTNLNQAILNGVLLLLNSLRGAKLFLLPIITGNEKPEGVRLVLSLRKVVRWSIEFSNN